jgi:hypothetical protein
MFQVNGAGETIIANGEELLTDAPGEKAEGTQVAIPPIPPNAEQYELTGITGYPKAVTMYEFHPHAHHRGKDFTYTVVYPDGREQTVLSVPRFDHRWQMSYELETPLHLPAGSKLVVTAHYDNSSMNMHNPAPDKPVYFRDMNQSWDEMFTPFVQYSIDDQDLRETAALAGDHQSKALEIGQVVGCLAEDPDGKWVVNHGTPPTSSDSQATDSAALKAAATVPLGEAHYPLLGVEMFNPTKLRERRVAVKGILVGGDDNVRINVTSLQAVKANCGNVPTS